MRCNAGTFWRAVFAGCVLLGHASSARAQNPTRSTVVIPLKKEKASAKVVTIHDTVTMVRVDTVRVIQTVVRTDTIFRVDTLRDSCASAALPIPTSAAPEPATFLLVGSGLAAVFGFARYRKRK